MIALALALSTAHAIRWPGVCATLLALENVSPKSAARASERLVSSASHEELIVRRYLAQAAGVRWAWDLRRGRVRVTFPPNRREYNDALLAVASVLAFAYDDRLFYIQPIRPARVRRSPVALLVGLDVRGSEGMEHAAPHLPLRDRLRLDLATLEVSGAPVREPTTQHFVTFDALLDRAERFAFLMTQPEFHWLELRTSPVELYTSRARLRRLIHDHR